jgi:hypothetical protein
MMVSVPSRAASGPPDTGASTQRKGACRRSRAAMSRVASGLIVEWSTTILPVSRAVARPFSPKQQFSTAGASSTHIRTMSLAAATAPGESARRAPAASTLA